MIFLGPLYQLDREEELISASSCGISNATNQFQMRFLRGINANGTDVNVINVVPVGVWPVNYKKAFLPSEKWQLFGNDCYEIGSINVPFLKQYHRELKVKKKLYELAKNDKEIVIYSTYLPFLRAAKKLPSDVKLTLIVTDLPEYYDLGKTSLVTKILRKFNNLLIYKCLKRIDRFVLLTDEMKHPLKVGERPYVVVEGICDSMEGEKPSHDCEQEIIFYSGTLHGRFGINKLLEAFSMIDRPTARLWICGDGDSREAVIKAAEADERIKYFGYVTFDKVTELRSKSTVLINPRSNDGEYTKYSFPSKTMEYMTSGVPVVMYKLSGIPSGYDDHLIYVEENSPEGIKNAIERVFSMSAEERTKFGADSREYILNNKNEAVQAKAVLDMINIL